MKQFRHAIKKHTHLKLLTNELHSETLTEYFARSFNRPAATGDLARVSAAWS
jgi:hypothetical protein